MSGWLGSAILKDFANDSPKSSSNRTPFIVRASYCRSPASLEAGCGSAGGLRRHSSTLIPLLTLVYRSSRIARDVLDRVQEHFHALIETYPAGRKPFLRLSWNHHSDSDKSAAGRPERRSETAATKSSTSCSSHRTARLPIRIGFGRAGLAHRGVIPLSGKGRSLRSRRGESRVWAGRLGRAGAERWSGGSPSLGALLAEGDCRDFLRVRAGRSVS